MGRYFNLDTENWIVAMEEIKRGRERAIEISSSQGVKNAKSNDWRTSFCIDSKNYYFINFWWIYSVILCGN